MKEEGIVVSCLSRLMFYSRKDFGIPGNEGHRGFLLDGSSWRSEISVGLGWCRYFPERQKIGTLPNSLGLCSTFAVHPGGYLVSLFLLKYCEAFIKMLNAPQTRLLGN